MLWLTILISPCVFDSDNQKNNGGVIIVRYIIMRIRLTEDTMCAGDKHEIINYPRASFQSKPTLPAGTELEVEKEWCNFYGCYYRCSTPDGKYDIPINKAKIIYK